jgi:hypothetical protein
VSIWAPVVAAIGASGLTGLSGFGTIWWQQRRLDRREAQAKKEQAYSQLIAHSLSFTIRAGALRNAMQMRSGLGEGLDVVTGTRKPLDPLEFHDWFAQGTGPINEAWSTIEVIGTPDAVRAATALVDACADLVGIATRPGEARGKVATVVKGLAWTPAQQNALDEATKRVMKERSAFIRICRLEMGRDFVEHELATTEPKELTQGPGRTPSTG